MVDYPPPHKTFSVGPAVKEQPPDRGTCIVCQEETLVVPWEESDDLDFCLSCQRIVVEGFRQMWKRLSRAQRQEMAWAHGLPVRENHDR